MTGAVLPRRTDARKGHLLPMCCSSCNVNLQRTFLAHPDDEQSLPLPDLDKVSHQEIIDGLRWSSHVDFADTLFEIGLFALRKADKGNTQVVTTRR